MLDIPPQEPPPIHAAPALEPDPSLPPDVAVESAFGELNETAENIDTAARQRSGKNAFTAPEIAKQIWQIQEWLVAGMRPNQIRKLCQQEWGLGTRTADSRITAARQQIVTDVNVMDRAQKVGQMVEQLEKVLEMSLATRQGSNAIGAIRLQSELLQLLAK